MLPHWFLRCAVLRHVRDESVVFNPRYLDFARHHGFTIAPCNVGRGNEKGRVESGVGYVKKKPDYAVASAGILE
jgi:transposase